MIKAVLFDLDGTLLPMDQDVFTKSYFKLLARKMAPYGYEAQPLIDGIWAGTAAMVKNDCECTNEEAFWRRFSEIFGEQALEHKYLFEEFYAVDFQAAEQFCGKNPDAAKTVYEVKSRGLRTALATNPIFPETATRSRIRWAGLVPEDFEFYTTYETTDCCKPNPHYYLRVAERIGLSPEECLMVGNDADEDMIARSVGMKVFLLTDCMINKHDIDIGQYPHGGFPELRRYICELD